VQGDPAQAGLAGPPNVSCPSGAPSAVGCWGSLDRRKKPRPSPGLCDLLETCHAALEELAHVPRDHKHIGDAPEQAPRAGEVEHVAHPSADVNLPRARRLPSPHGHARENPSPAHGLLVTQHLLRRGVLGPPQPARFEPREANIGC